MRRYLARPAIRPRGRRPGLISKQHVVPRLAERSEHVIDERPADESGRPTPTRRRQKSRHAERSLDAAQAVMPTQTLPFFEAHLAEGQLDLIVHHQHALDGDLVPAGRLGSRLVRTDS